MSCIIISKNTNQCLNETLTEKECQFPGCKEKFKGRGLEKYCYEHRKKEYHKKLYHNKYKKDKEKNEKKALKENNQIIKHHNCETFIITSMCALKNCYEEFKITISPGNYIYPKYCPKHRNLFKRELFLQNLKEEGR